MAHGMTLGISVDQHGRFHGMNAVFMAVGDSPVYTTDSDPTRTCSMAAPRTCPA
jgi:hypothetical protein